MKKNRLKHLARALMALIIVPSLAFCHNEGQKTDVYIYQAVLIKGKRSSLQEIPNAYLGPIIRVKPQEKIRVRFNNELSDESIIHWHGLHVPHEMDGHPMHVIKNRRAVYL